MKSIQYIRKAKGLFLKFRTDRFIPYKTFEFLAQSAKLSKWISQHTDIGFCDFYTSEFNYPKRFKLYEYLIETQKLDAPIDYLEFGVSKGVSFRWWVDKIQHPDARFYGFDTFTGLPEAWGPFKAGAMSNGNVPPQLEGNRHTFYQGLFQQTLIPFLKTYQPQKRKVIHMDADIYSATLFVLTTITPFLNKGDLILFDEFNVPMHEFKAFSEWVASFYIEYEVLGSVNNFYQTAILIK
ncbi:class I SAM-dependent methyltransferase [Pontibacter harenae]|uniref:class I SAM-dependent methyltransferase n=1 Tax=Pontibacter harenae TaxID=2894083 RepID=UPI001E646666|nr:class I SAM-dependent methyltransferase [Pontibacter harenae]MCC9166016.1 class I SAM-dependent methyltransferase [Pontibacter harenae]